MFLSPALHLDDNLFLFRLLLVNICETLLLCYFGVCSFCKFFSILTKEQDLSLIIANISKQMVYSFNGGFFAAPNIFEEPKYLLSSFLATQFFEIYIFKVAIGVTPVSPPFSYNSKKFGKTQTGMTPYDTSVTLV